MRKVAFIPARYDSQRLPGKVLIKFAGYTSLVHVFERVRLSAAFDEIYVVTGDEQVIAECEAFRIPMLRSERNHSSGTSRVGEQLERLRPDFIAFIVQADEVLIDPVDLAFFALQVTSLGTIVGQVSAVNSISSVRSPTELVDASVVKCSTSTTNRIVSCFRKSPYITDEANRHVYHLNGLMAFFPAIFKSLSKIYSLQLEVARLEKIEQLNLVLNDYLLFSIQLPPQPRSLNTLSDQSLIAQSLTNDNQKKIVEQYFKSN